MSGIVGFWNLDGRPVEPEVLARCSATLAHRGPDGEGRWHDGPAALACRLLRVTPAAVAERQPVIAPGGAVLVFDGRLDNRAELLERLPAAPGLTATAPDPVLVAAAWEAFGDDFPARLAGDFALALFDPARPCLLLARDAIGVRTLYHARAGDTVLFASEAKAILAHPAVRSRPNVDALANFLLNGRSHRPEATFFEGLQSVLPAHLLAVTRAGTVSRRYWDFDGGRQIRLASIDGYAEAFREHFGRAVERRLRSAAPVAVSVSGGLDSSSIFCVARGAAARAPGRLAPVLGFSYLYPEGSPADERRFLDEVERVAGPIRRVPSEPPGVMTAPREAVWHVETPLMDETWLTTRALLGAARAAGARSILTGHFGDQVLFPRGYLVDHFRRLRWRTLLAHLDEFSRWGDTHARFYRGQFVRDLLREVIPSPLLGVLRRMGRRRPGPWYSAALRRRVRFAGVRAVPRGKRFASAHARAMYEEARTGYHVQCMEWQGKAAALHGLDIALPFLDRDLLAFLMAIPGDVQTWQGVPRGLLRRALRGILPAAVEQRRSKADFSDAVTAGLEREHAQIVECFGAGAQAARWGFLRSDVLGAELARLKGRIHGPTCEIAWDLSDLVGLEFWLRAFFPEGKGDSAWTASGRPGSAIGLPA